MTIFAAFTILAIDDNINYNNVISILFIIKNSSTCDLILFHKIVIDNSFKNVTKDFYKFCQKLFQFMNRSRFCRFFSNKLNENIFKVRLKKQNKKQSQSIFYKYKEQKNN